MHANDTDVLVHGCGTSAHSERSQVRFAMADGADVESNTLGTAAPETIVLTRNGRIASLLLIILLGCGIIGLCTVPFIFPAIESQRRLDLASNDTVAVGYNLRTTDGRRVAIFNDQRMRLVLTAQHSTLEYVLFSPNKGCLRRHVDGTYDMTFFVPLDMQKTGILPAPTERDMFEIAVAFGAMQHMTDPVRFVTSRFGATINALETELSQYVSDALRHAPAMANVSVAQFKTAFGAETKLKLVPVFSPLDWEFLSMMPYLTHGL